MYKAHFINIFWINLSSTFISSTPLRESIALHVKNKLLSLYSTVVIRMIRKMYTTQIDELSRFCKSIEIEHRYGMLKPNQWRKLQSLLYWSSHKSDGGKEPSYINPGAIHDVTPLPSLQRKSDTSRRKNGFYNPFPRQHVSKSREVNGVRLGLYSADKPPTLELGIRRTTNTYASQHSRTPLNACLHRQYMSEVKKQATWRHESRVKTLFVYLPHVWTNQIQSRSFRSMFTRLHYVKCYNYLISQLLC